MYWVILAFMSATLFGFYDSFKKKALKGNAVIPVLFLNTVLSSLIFIPFIIVSYNSDALDGTIFHVGSGGWEMHKFIVLKSCIVLSSWILGYFGIKHLPKQYREALILYTHLREHPYLVYHDAVMDADYDDYQDMSRKYPNRVEQFSQLKDTYGKTYWFYFFTHRHAHPRQQALG